MDNRTMYILGLCMAIQLAGTTLTAYIVSITSGMLMQAFISYLYMVVVSVGVTIMISMFSYVEHASGAKMTCILQAFVGILKIGDGLGWMFYFEYHPTPFTVPVGVVAGFFILAGLSYAIEIISIGVVSRTVWCPLVSE